MRAALPAEVLAILNIQSSPGSLTSAGVALDATFPLVEEWLETELVTSERTDYFHLPGTYSNPLLRLTNGFLTDVSPTILVNELYYKTGGAALDPALYQVDRAAGALHLLGTGFGKCTISVQYVSGFESKPADASALDEVPDLIRTAHATLAAAYLQLNPANVSKDKAKVLGALSVNGYYVTAKQTLRRLQRPRGRALMPDLTVVIS